MPKKNGQDLDFQLDLTPFISLLSVCICFLLLTVAWFQIGALTVKQALGGEPADGRQKEKSSLWVYIEPARPAGAETGPAAENPPSPKAPSAADGPERTQTIRIKVKKGSRRLAGEALTLRRGQRGKLKKHIQAVRRSWPDLDQAFILPEKNVLYEDVVKVIDSARQAGVLNIGIAPI